MYTLSIMRMAGALKGIAVLVVEDDPDTLELFMLSLSAVGATVKRAASAEEALEQLEGWKPDVILCDIQLPGVDGYSLREIVHANPHLHGVPMIAITGSHPSVESAREQMKGFAKFLLKPAKLPDIVIAVASVVAEQPNRGSSPHLAGAPGSGASMSRELRDILSKLNAATPCRYTSLLRVDAGDTLTSIWTYDRKHPAVDPFPLGLPVHASFSVMVREARGPVSIENAATDPRVVGDPKRAALASYLGVPLFNESGKVFGTVCCYDEVPRKLDDVTRIAVEAAAKELQPLLWSIFPERAVQH